VNVIEHHAAKKLANAGHRWQQLQGLGLVGLGGVEAREFAVLKQLIIRGAERQIDRHGLWHGGIGTALGDTRAVGLLGDVRADLGQVVLRRGLWPRGQACRTCAHQVGTASEQVPGGAPLGRRDLGLWEPAPAPQGGNLVGSALVVFGRATMDGVHREGRPQDEGNALVRPEVGEPGPR
jgi:hypothetical protein